MNKEQKLSNILKTFEKLGFKSEIITDELQQPYQIELESWTDGGVDMIEYLDFSNNPQEIYDEHIVVSKLHDCYQNFSVDEEIDLHRQSEDYKNAFSISESLEDFKNYEEFLNNAGSTFLTTFENVQETENGIEMGM